MVSTSGGARDVEGDMGMIVKSYMANLEALENLDLPTLSRCLSAGDRIRVIDVIRNPLICSDDDQVNYYINRMLKNTLKIVF